MTSIIERGVNLCFSDDILQTVALDILRNSKSSDNPKSLQFLSVKSIMSRKMRKKTVYSNLIFSLIFGEPVKIEDFSVRLEIYNSWFEKMRTKIQRFITGDPEKIFLKLRTDPIIMQAVFQQNLSNSMFDCALIQLKRKTLEITLPWIIHFCIWPMEIELENEYDTHWAAVFLRILLAKRLRRVTFRMEGEGNYTFDEMQNLMKPMFDSLNPKIPPEGWKEAIENGRPSIYTRNAGVLIDWKKYSVSFEVDKSREFKEYMLPAYWGYLED